MKDKKFWRSAITNNETYIDYLYRVRKLACSRFIWNNIPPSWDANFLETVLYEFGHIGVIKHPSYNTLLVKSTLHGINIYNNPIQATPFDNMDKFDKEIQRTRYVYNGFIDSIDDMKNKIVIIKNNNNRVPTFRTVDLFCRRLSLIERTLDINLNQQKTPLMILCDPKQRLTLKNLYMKYEGNEPFIFADKSLFEHNSITSLNTGAPFLLDKLTAYKQQLWNELLTFLGLNNINFEKKERLISDEANANNNMIRINLEEELKCREIGARQVNEYFGLNINVDINPILSNIVKNIVEEVNKNE